MSNFEFLAWLIGGCLVFAAPFALNLRADARAGNRGRVMYLISAALFLAFFLVAALWWYPSEPVTGALCCSWFAFELATSWVKARQGARIKRMNAVSGMVSRWFRKKTPAKLDVTQFHPRHWLPVYQSWSLYRAGAIPRFEVWTALFSSLSLAGIALVAFSPHDDAGGVAFCIFLGMAFSLDCMDEGMFRPCAPAMPTSVPTKRISTALWGLALSAMLLGARWHAYGDAAYAAACVACTLFFITRIANEGAVLLRTAAGRRALHGIFSTIVCWSAFFLMVLAYSRSRSWEAAAPLPPVLPRELLLMAFCLCYPLRRLVFFLLFQCLEALWLRLGSRRTWRAAYLRVRQMWLFEGVMAALAAAALLRALSTNASSFATLNFSLCALLALPLLLRFVQKARPAL